MDTYLATTVYGIPVQRWLLLLGIGALCFTALRLLQALLTRRLSKLAERTHQTWDDLLAASLRATRPFFLLALSLYIGAVFVVAAPRAQGVVFRILTVALLAQAGLWISAALSSWLTLYRQRQAAKDAAAATTVGALGFVLKLALWAVILLLVLDNVGVDVTALVAGLGVGGIAVALAVQNVLGDLFASLSIVLDKPFVLGDFVIVGDFLGTVEHVGLKTTRLRSLSGEQIIFSNSDLLQSRVRNYGRMYQRRIVFTLGVTYQTPRRKLELIPGLIRAAVEAQENTRFDRSHFKTYGAFSLDFETVYYVTVPDYNRYMEVQQGINFAIHAAFEAEGIEFAYPTQTLFVTQSS